MVTSWTSWGASCRGGTHIRLGIPCQDAWITRRYSWGDLAVVCDGMGSCPEALRGAQAACRAAAVSAKMFSAQSGASIDDLLALLHAQWKFFILPHAPKDCRTTCLFALRCKEELFLAQLGDGMLITCHNGVATVVFGEEEKSFVNVTTGLGEQNRLEHWHHMRLPESEVDAVLLATDGIADDLLPERRGDFACDLLAETRTMTRRRLVSWLNHLLGTWSVPGPSDDRTIVCMYREEGSHASRG